MDDLRWILAIAGTVVVVAIYLSSRFEREEWKRDREARSGQSQVVTAKKLTPQFKTQANDAKSPESKAQQTTHVIRETDVNEVLVDVEQEISSGIEKTEESKGEWEGVAESAREPLIEDEIVDVEIPAEFSEYGEERRSQSRLKLKPEIENPVQQELVLDVEPLMLVLTVLAKDEHQFNGGDIKNVLEAERLKHGDMDIFHFHMTGKKDSVFSVASVVEPGVFDLPTIDDYETPGLSLFCQFPNPMAGAGAFDILLKKSRSIADKLNGQLCDDKRNQLTEQATAHYRDRITAFEHEVVLARKKQE
ncbi:MAG: cell division protein ZipA [Gammaproteobacteria bacterium]|nr:cell division protein ZipA [Gammaproteobacteria bacterium]